MLFSIIEFLKVKFPLLYIADPLDSSLEYESAIRQHIEEAEKQKVDSKGKIYSYTQYDALGRQSLRIDFQGRPHKGVLPHIHAYMYRTTGGGRCFTYDLSWKLIDMK